MTNNINEEMEAEETGEEIGPEPQGPPTRREGGSLWVILTVTFVVLCAILVWLYASQLDQMQTLQAEVDQANQEAASLRQVGGRVAGEIVELGHQAALEAELQESLGNVKRTEAEIHLSRKFLDLAAQLSPTAASSQKQAVVDKLKEVEDKLYPPAEKPEAEPATEVPAATPAEGEIPSPE